MPDEPDTEPDAKREGRRNGEIAKRSGEALDDIVDLSGMVIGATARGVLRAARGIANMWWS
jgi:hypothetical protein